MTTSRTARNSEIRALRLVPSSAAQEQLAAELSATAQRMQQLVESQQRINALVAQLGNQAKTKAPPSREAIEAQQDAKLLAVVAGKTLWLPEAARAAGLSKQVADATARRLAYDRKLWMSLEPGPAGKLTFRLRSLERVAVE